MYPVHCDEILPLSFGNAINRTLYPFEELIKLSFPHQND